MLNTKEVLKPINFFFFFLPFLCFKNDQRDLFENILPKRKKEPLRIKPFVRSFSLEQNLMAEL